MNAVEHIVESYFRYCRNCFTMVDVKIIGGNNRQCDLLAFNLATQEQFHVESSVTHDLNWLPSEDTLRETFDKKFHKLKARVKKAGFDVRTRSGFFGVSEEEEKRLKPTRASLTRLGLKICVSLSVKICRRGRVMLPKPGIVLPLRVGSRHSAR